MNLRRRIPVFQCRDTEGGFGRPWSNTIGDAIPEREAAVAGSTHRASRRKAVSGKNAALDRLRYVPDELAVRPAAFP